MSSRPNPLATQQKTPILPLTSVRIFAALYVVVLHCFLWSSHLYVTTWLGRFIRNGYTAVGFFFTLSGFILAHVYLNTDKPLNRRAFWTSRFARAYPLLFASLLLDVPRDLMIRMALHGPLNGVLRTFTMLAGESMLLQSWLTIFTGLNSPSWSLSAEAFFYLLFPFAALWIWRRKGAASIALFVMFWLCAMSTPSLVTHLRPALFIEVPASVMQHNIEVMPIFRVFEFFAGISTCAFQQTLRARLTDQQRSRFGWGALIAAGVLFCASIQFSNSIPLLVMSDGFLLPVYSLTILGLVNVRGWLQRLMSQPLFVLLGEASYAVYLLHGPLFEYVSGVHAIDSPGMWIAYLGLVMTLSIASFLWLERPVRRKILAWASIRPPVTLTQESVTV
jgi:peptidoglycan/LPS O-acetylase OafA/YrhL